MKKFLIPALCSCIAFVCPLYCFGDECKKWKESFNNKTKEYIEKLGNTTSAVGVLENLEKSRNAYKDLIQINCNIVPSNWAPIIATLALCVAVVVGGGQLFNIYHNWNPPQQVANQAIDVNIQNWPNRM
jgi:hypothetical protein